MGLASLGQPSTSIHMEIQKEEALMNTSMMYMHNVGVVFISLMEPFSVLWKAPN